MDLRRFIHPGRPSTTALAGALAFGLALALGLGFGVALGTAAPRRALGGAKIEVGKALVIGNELRQKLDERHNALRLLAATEFEKERPTSVRPQLEALRRIYPQFESIEVRPRLPEAPTEPLPNPGPRPLRLSVPLDRGGYLVGTLRKLWADELPGPGMAFGTSEGPTTVLASRRGTRTGGAPAPPAWPILSKLNDRSFKPLVWGDGKVYRTSVHHVPGAGENRIDLAVVVGYPKSRIDTEMRKVQWAALLFGGALGIAAGIVAWVGIARSTRRLRGQNAALEGRVAARTAELAMAERSFRSLFENAPFGLYQCDLEGRLVRVNATLAQMLGFTDAEAMIGGLGSLQAIGDRTARVRFLERLRADGEMKGMTFAVGEHGRPMWLQETARVVEEPVTGASFIEGAMHDVTEQRNMEDRLRQIGATDPLTGLLNRRGLEEAMESVEGPVSFVIVDLDGFKRYNDTYGHPAGDVALRVVADAIRRSVRTDDVVARAGGEEFVVVLSRTPTEGAWRVAENLRETVAQCVAGLERPLTVSGGVATANVLEELDEAYAAADRALYMAKEGGRNRIVVNPVQLV